MCVDVIKGNNQAALLGYRCDANPNVDTRVSLAGFVMRNAALRHADGGSKLGLLQAELFSDCGYVVHGHYISAAHEKRQTKSAGLKAQEVRASCASATPLQNARMNDNDKEKAKVTEENREESRRLKAIYDARKAEGKLPQSQAAVGHDLKIGTQAMVSHCLHVQQRPGSTSVTQSAHRVFALVCSLRRAFVAFAHVLVADGFASVCCCGYCGITPMRHRPRNQTFRSGAYARIYRQVAFIGKQIKDGFARVVLVLGGVNVGDD